MNAVGFGLRTLYEVYYLKKIVKAVIGQSCAHHLQESTKQNAPEKLQRALAQSFYIFPCNGYSEERNDTCQVVLVV